MSNFEKFEELGRGSSATVFAGYDHSLQRDIAIKELHESIRNDESSASLFWEEARFFAQLSHGNIVSVYGVDEEQGWIIMERMYGSLEQELAKGPLSTKRVRSILSQVLHGLEYLHQNHKIHGEIKPGNLLVDAHGIVKLSDSPGVDLAGEFRKPNASQRHIAPEILNAEQFGEPGFGIDLYCLGIVALELLTGAKFIKLFKGIRSENQHNPMAWAAWHASAERLPPVSSIVKKMPSDLARVVDCLLSKHVCDRFQTASEALAELESDASSNNATSDDVLSELEELPSTGTVHTTQFDAPDIYGQGRNSRVVQPTDPYTQLLNSVYETCPWLRSKGTRQGILVAAMLLIVGMIFIDSAPNETIENMPTVTLTANSTGGDDKQPNGMPESTLPKLCFLQVIPSGDQEVPMQNVKIWIDNEPLEAERHIGKESESIGANPETRNGGVFETKVEAGVHWVRIEADHYVPFEKPVVLSSDAPTHLKPQLAAKLFPIEFQVDPPTACVKLNGKPALVENGIATTVHKFGVVRVSATADGYRPFACEFRLPSVELLVHPVNLVRNPVPRTLTMEFDSWPNAAEIWVDGKSTGKRTPAPCDLTEGRHEIVLKRGGYHDVNYTFDVTESRSRKRCFWYLDTIGSALNQTASNR